MPYRITVAIAICLLLLNVGCGRAPAPEDLVEEMKSEDAAEREKAAEQLTALGVDAIAPLLAGFDRNDHDPAIKVLAAIGKPAVPALIKALRNKDTQVRRVAALSLKDIGKPAASAVPALLPLLDDDACRGHSAVTLMALRVHYSKPLAPLLLPKLAGSKSTWGQVCTILYDCGPSAVPFLIGGLRSENPRVRAGVAQVLYRFEKLAIAAVPALVRARGDADSEAADHAGGALMGIGAVRTADLPQIVSLLGDSNVAIRIAAADVIADYADVKSPAARRAIPLLVRLLGDPNEKMNSSAIDALEKLGKPDITHQSALIKLIGHADARVRKGATQGLVAIAKQLPKDMVPVLGRLLKDKDENTAGAAGTLLALMGPDAASQVPQLMEALGNRNSTICDPAGKALRAIGAPAVLALIKALKHVSLKWKAGPVLRAISKDTKDPELRKKIKAVLLW